MALNISLIKYCRDKDNNLTEDGSKEIESAPLTEKIYKIIEDSSCIIKKNVQEEGTLDTYEIDVLDISKITDILNAIKNIIKQNAQKMCEPFVSEEDEDKILNLIRLDLNIRNLILQKKEQYHEEKDVFLVLN